MSRIYFVSSYGQDPEEPTNHLCYWDSATNEITAVSTVVDYDLGLGYIARTGAGQIVVTGMRYYRYTGDLIDYGDWWDARDEDYDQASLTEDALLYTLDQDLKNPQVLVRDTLWQGRGSTPGWEPSPHYQLSSFTGGEFTYPEVDKSNGEILLYGARHRDYVSDDDASEGESIHRYNTQGDLLGAHVPYEGYSQWTGQPEGWITSLGGSCQAFAHDYTRRLGYLSLGGNLLRYNFNDGTYEGCFNVFFVVQTSSGYNIPNAGGTGTLPIDNGPDYGDFRYGFIGAGSLFRSRDRAQMAVDPTTGYIGVIVGGYMPYGQNTTTTVPPGPDAGGRQAPSMQWQLVCVDPEKLFWRPTFNPFPYSEYPYPGSPPPGWYPMPEPIYTDAIVKTIPLWNGPLGPDFGSRANNGQQINSLALDSVAGVAYYNRLMPADGGNAYVDSVWTVDLNTGATSEVFRDARVSTDGSGSLLSQAIYQIVLGGPDLNITGQVDATRVRPYYG